MRWRMSLLVVLTGLLVGSGTRVGLASCQVAHESAAYVIGLLTGDDVEGFVFTDPGAVLAVVEKETVKRWEAIPTHTSASATIVFRYWGEPPASVFEPVIDGAEPTATTETTISCDPSVARSLGDTRLGVVFERVGYVPLIDDALTAQQEQILASELGREVQAIHTVLPIDHPMAGRAGDAGETSTSSSVAVPWGALVGGALLVVALGGWIASRRASRRSTPSV